MKLQALCKKLKKLLCVDENLLVYVFDTKIELVDHMSEIKDENSELIIDEFFGDLGAISIKDNKISAIDNPTMRLITPANRNIICELCDLIGHEITDYSTYEKLDNNIDMRDVRNITPSLVV